MTPYVGVERKPENTTPTKKDKPCLFKYNTYSVLETFPNANVIAVNVKSH